MKVYRAAEKKIHLQLQPFNTHPLCWRKAKELAVFFKCQPGEVLQLNKQLQVDNEQLQVDSEQNSWIFGPGIETV